jgi:hypothetical protein
MSYGKLNPSTRYNIKQFGKTGGLIRHIFKFFVSDKHLVHVVVDPVFTKVLRPHQREVSLFCLIIFKFPYQEGKERHFKLG